MTEFFAGLDALYRDGIQPTLLDRRTPDDIYAACLAAARRDIPSWAIGFDDDPHYFDRTDVGLVLFKLFGELFQKLNMPLNAIPVKYVFAFWDFMGISLRPPEAAEAPIAFTATGTRAIPVPIRTRVIGRTAPGVVFETTDPLLVLPMRIAAAYGVQPDNDSYVDYSTRIAGHGAPFDLFGADAEQMPFVHAIYIDDPSFAFMGGSGSLVVGIEGANLYPTYFHDWKDATGVALRPERTVADYDMVSFTFVDLPRLPTARVDGIAGTWIRVAPAPGQRIVDFKKTSLPQIQAISLTIAIDAVAADMTLFNATPADLTKGGRPFGTTPAEQDAFYISSTVIFSRRRADVTLTFDMQPIDLTTALTLTWEYWDGDGWAALDVKDGTARLTRCGTVTFTCPRIEPTAIDGKTNYWIRVRIISGGYGNKAGVLVTESAEDVLDDILAPYLNDPKGAAAALAQKNINFGFAYRPETYAPPFIEALSLAAVSSKSPSRVLIQNGFDTDVLDRNPYTPASERVPTFYLGLKSQSYDTEVAGKPLTLFFAPDRTSIGRLATSSANLAHTAQSVTTDALTAEGWTQLASVQTETQSSRSGVSTFAAPAEFPESRLFGASLRWLRCRARPGTQGRLDTASVHVNVVAATNATLHDNIILGSSTGAPSQAFAFPQKPILADPVVQVLEPVPATFAEEESDLVAMASQQLHASRLFRGGSLTEAWLKWSERQNFDFSIPASRHYVLDHETGEIGFGDGVRGKIPPKGQDNIRASTYRSGGGTVGNVAIGVLDTLRKAIHGIGISTNVTAATGGAASDVAGDLLLRAPSQVMNQGLAVTCSDFANIALVASQDVVRAICDDAGSTSIRLAILTRDAGQTPRPTLDLRNAVAGFVRARALPLLASRLTVDGPDYLPIEATIRLRLAVGSYQTIVTEALKSAYAAFLHPLTGGDNGLGWTFGSRLTASTIATMAGNVPGVAAILGVRLGVGGASASVDLAVAQLPAPGLLLCEFDDADAI